MQRSFALAAAVLVAVFLAARPAVPAPAAQRAAARADTGSVLVPTDSGYADAMAFADLLQRAGIRIAGVARSKLAGFLGRPGAASFATDRGRFAVVFFPEPDGAERVTWEVKKQGALYRHTFRWNDGAREHTEKMTTDAPQRLLRSGPWFIFTWSDSTYETIQEVLAYPHTGVG